MPIPRVLKKAWITYSGTGWSGSAAACVISRAKRMVDASIALGVRFGDSAGTAELMSMLALEATEIFVESVLTGFSGYPSD